MLKEAATAICNPAVLVVLYEAGGNI